MRNSITVQFTEWLTIYRNDDDSSQKTLAGLLITQLKTVNSIQELQDVLQKISKTNYEDSKFTFFSDNEFFQQINLWMSTLKRLINDQNAAAQKLLAINPETSQEHLNILLGHPKFLLHQNAPQLLDIINSESLDTIKDLSDHIFNDINAADPYAQEQVKDPGCNLM